ncbi:MAG: diadenylate cyclase CdaA [Marinifilaceae bacterium]
MLLFLKLGIFDVIDILLVAFIIYQVYRLVKGTAAMNILAGIFTFFMVWLLVRALNMELISSILGQFIGVGVLAFLIVFQQEVRRFLLLVGSKYNLQNVVNFNSVFTRPVMEDGVTDAIVMACKEFSSTRTGALIVIAQNTELYSYIHTGVLLSAKPSTELLENLFFKNSPLHDGAVIIQNNKIVAARCILPVSDRSDIPGSMGLRHRAALGLSANSDALVVVVSEETGGITFVKDGKYKAHLRAEDLKQYLVEAEEKNKEKASNK